jgi:two-component system, NtrC family, response regulator AtoC
VSVEEDELGLTAITQVVPGGGTDLTIPGRLELCVISNGAMTTHALPDAGAIAIGRSSTCEIAVNDESMSRRHAVLTLGETITIEDLGSVNGTVARGARIQPGRAVAISVGELVGLGTASIIVQRRTRTARPRRVWTHEQFTARLEEECAREERSGAPFALIRLQFSFRAPANVVEEALGELLRDSDILGRHGPHQYEVLLPDVTPANAEDAMRRIERTLSERGLGCRASLACCPRDGQTAAQLDARAALPVTHDPTTAGTAIVVADPRMRDLYRLVEQIAVSDISVLLLGETGVGKEVLARAVHAASPRASGPFVELNCAALTEPLLESELFGHEKGAFTNAVAAKPGLLETADGGTMFLDEIGDMPLATQVKLLRVIEDSQLRRVGGLKPRPINVRFIAATNSDIEQQVGRGGFRSDLYFRLNGVTIVIPPLRERIAEIEPLARAFIRRASRRTGAPRPALSAGALEVLRGYSWPGNVRELKNVIERAVLLCGTGPIEADHIALRPTMSALLPLTYSDESREMPTREVPPLARPRKGSPEEQEWILRALEQTNGNQTHAARLLGISRRTLVNRLAEYGDVLRPRNKA